MDVLLFIATVTIGVVNATKESHRHSSGLLPTLLHPSLKDGTSLDGNERVCTVSKDNIPTLNGHLRSEMRLNNLWHRATYILVKQHHVNNQSHDGNDDNITILVQRRTMIKDYCPGKLDPTPGGVVGFGESCRDNAIRELQEEMNITIDRVLNDPDYEEDYLDKQDEIEEDENDENDEGRTTKLNTMKRLFTFSYSDNVRVNVWGEFFEVDYYGNLEDIKIQKEEVDEVIPMTIKQLKESMTTNPNDYMPDSIYAMKLYFQRKQDYKFNRKLLGKGYSSGDLDTYKLRPKPKVIFFDCDDTLYFDNWVVANQLTHKINEYCVNQIGLKPGKAYELYKQYGTALKGLIAEGHIENTTAAIDTYLEYVHDIPIHTLIKPDLNLRRILQQLDPNIPKYIFTASVSYHAHRCLKALGIDDLFHPTIIDVKTCNLETKHSPSSFQIAMDVAATAAASSHNNTNMNGGSSNSILHPEECVFLDDSIKNIHAARQIGWRSVLVGRVGRDCGKPVSSDHAELEIDRIHEIETVLPECFVHTTT